MWEPPLVPLDVQVVVRMHLLVKSRACLMGNAGSTNGTTLSLRVFDQTGRENDAMWLPVPPMADSTDQYRSGFLHHGSKILNPDMPI